MILAFNSPHDIAGWVYMVHSAKGTINMWAGKGPVAISVNYGPGALVYVAGQLEIRVGVLHAWMIVISIFGAIMILLSIWHVRFLPIGGTSAHVTSLNETMRTFWDVVKTFFQKKNIWWGITFIILYRFAEGQAIKIVPLFFRATREAGGLGLTTSEIGIVYGTFGAAAFILGSILAGYFIAKRGLKIDLCLCCFFNLPLLHYNHHSASGFVIIGRVPECRLWIRFVGLTVHDAANRLGKYKMAHYAFATAIMYLGFMLPSMVSGYISDFLGYKNFFVWVLFATIPSFLATWLVPFRETDLTDTVQRAD
jgi:PAT family beta-lactamase induction signal transducer AmpG